MTDAAASMPHLTIARRDSLEGTGGGTRKACDSMVSLKSISATWALFNLLLACIKLRTNLKLGSEKSYDVFLGNTPRSEV
jgi:hypothetical protein